MVLRQTYLACLSCHRYFHWYNISGENSVARKCVDVVVWLLYNSVAIHEMAVFLDSEFDTILVCECPQFRSPSWAVPPFRCQ